MAPTTSTAVKPNSMPKSTQPLIPPDEKFWQRYSPHHEMLMSGLGSFTLHLLILGGLILAGVLGLFTLLNKQEPAIEIAGMGVEGLPGSPGTPGGNFGVGGGGPPRDGNNSPKTEAVGENQPKPPSDVPELNNVPQAKVSPDQFPELMKDPSTRSYVTGNNDALAKISKLSQSARNALMAGLNEGTASNASNTGGNPGPNGVGGQNGDSGRLSVRAKRALRWVLHFTPGPNDGQDFYADQLTSLNAIMAVPQQDGSYMVYRDLKKRPVQGQPEDLTKIKMIYWVDDNPKEIGHLAASFGLKEVPPHIVGYFPQEFETKLAELERTKSGIPEDQIQETHFTIERKGTRHEPILLKVVPIKK